MFGRPDDWEVVARSLADDYRVNVPRLPVFDFRVGACGLTSLRDHVLRLIDQLGYDSVVLCGNSLGGHLAILSALEIPSRVTGLVLTGSSGLFERGLEQGFEKGVPRKPGRDWLYGRILEVFFDPVHITEELLDDVAETISDRRTVLNIVRLARAVRKSNVRNDLARITCPVTLVWGRQDQITPPEVAEDFHQHLPQSTLHYIDECGHTPPIERPEKFLTIMREALREMSPEAAANG